MATRINEDIYRDMVESGEIQLSDILPQDYGYVGNIEEDSEFNTPYTTRNRTGMPVSAPKRVPIRGAP